MRIAILYDDVESRPDAPPDERGVLEAVEAVELALRDLGHAPVRVPVGAALDEWLTRLLAAEVALVFNLCEGAGGSSANEARVAAAIELMGVPMTGNPSETLALARRKDLVYALLAAAGEPVPAWLAFDPGEPPPAPGWFPAIVKPADEDASVGISQRSVVRNDAEFAAAVAAARRSAGLVVQQFLDGRELNVGIVGDEVLPIAEIDFAALPEGAWPLVTYEAKWVPGSPEDLGTRPVCPASLDEATRREAVRLARAAWRLVGGRGYGRVDLRADRHGRLHVLDVNPNPDLAPSAGLARMAAAHGWDYVDLVARIVREALP
jgi:D-alanine-D-alanine ligase